ncbi:UNVERIFIED_CONTAM: Ferritin-1, chloroplastic [Sesamum latifolium]|uniref:Ferritin n=1 Tax=Sesamum latifolium TaxID=2727402 RepID=A0AAW2XDW0_9LAMI
MMATFGYFLGCHKIWDQGTSSPHASVHVDPFPLSTCHIFTGLLRDNGLAAGASNETVGLPLTGVLFQPFEEVKKDELMVPTAPEVSLARQGFSEECEAAINEQINVEYCVSYVYHALYAYFDRDNVALKGLAKFFKEGSQEEREHAEKLMEYQAIAKYHL